MNLQLIVGVGGLILGTLAVLGQIWVSVAKAKAAASLAAQSSLTEEKKNWLSELLGKLADQVPLGVLGFLFWVAGAFVLGIDTITWGVG